jgi:hypothetical protein
LDYPVWQPASYPTPTFASPLQLKLSSFPSSFPFLHTNQLNPIILSQASPEITMAAQTHSHDGGATHSHDGFNAQEHGHSHEILDGPGSFLGREMPIVEGREWSERAFTIGIGG